MRYRRGAGGGSGIEVSDFQLISSALLNCSDRARRCPCWDLVDGSGARSCGLEPRELGDLIKMR